VTPPPWTVAVRGALDAYRLVRRSMGNEMASMHLVGDLEAILAAFGGKRG